MENCKKDLGNNTKLLDPKSYIHLVTLSLSDMFKDCYDLHTISICSRMHLLGIFCPLQS
jgi:hypothetical protein